jgi:thymidylate kinase
MFVICEGPDGTGKSTLIESARQKDKYFVRFQSSGPPPTLETVTAVLFWLRQFPKAIHVVCDRLPCISDRVYGPILRKVDLFKGLPLNFGLGAADVIIYCRPPIEVMMRNAQTGTHLAGVAEKQKALIQGYDELFMRIEKELPAKVIRYDFTKESAEELWARVFDR